MTSFSPRFSRSTSLARATFMALAATTALSFSVMAQTPSPAEQPPVGVTPGAVSQAAPAPSPATPNPAPAAASPSGASPSGASPSGASKNAAAPSVSLPNAGGGGPQSVIQAAKPKPKAAPITREWALSDDPTPTLQPETFYQTIAATERYGQIADKGGWPVVPGDLKPGSSGKNVAVLRKRLMIEGDLPPSQAESEKWDSALTEAVKHFQGRHGLRKTGNVSGGTLRAMNVPARVRFKQLASSAQRLAGINFAFGDRYVVVNIPSAAVETIEHGVVVKRYVAVVGDVDHRSPEVESRIVAINLNPTWTVPTSIIKNEIIPKMRKDPGYLNRARIRVLDGKGLEVQPSAINWNTEKAVNYTLRQDSGANNSLGSIRIQMPNKHAVYMHDTPSKSYFGREYRFLSHGCVRVLGVYDLAAWLLGPEWTGESLKQAGASGERQDLKLAQPTPVIWVYLTAWASADGSVHFADDVYQVDFIDHQALNE